MQASNISGIDIAKPGSVEMFDKKSLPVLLDVRVEVTVRLGSCRIPMRDVLDLQPDTVVQLDQQANDPVGLYVNDTLIGRGEVVVIEDHFGIKITELVEHAPGA